MEYTNYKINTDGAASANDGMAGVGVAIRDRDGRFIAGLAKNIGVASNIIAELLVIREILQLAKRHHIQSIHLESDSYVVLQLIHRGQSNTWTHQDLLTDILTLGHEFEEVWTSFCYREANGLADLLAHFER